MPTVDLKGDHWTYGCEHELSDWDCSKELPEGFKRSKDHTIVNSNGVAAQPNVSVYGYGGEINTPPSELITEQGHFLVLLADERLQPGCAINHRSNLHNHVRVPGLKDNLKHLKQLQAYIHSELPKVLPELEPIPKGNTDAERKRERRRRVSHQTFLTAKRLRQQLGAKSVKEFFELEVPHSSQGQVMWHAQPRVCVNLRQLLQTDTIEFRHFPGTLSPLRCTTTVAWCRDFLLTAFAEEPIEPLWNSYKRQSWPKFPEFNFGLEVGYQATASHNGLKQAEIKRNIQLILEGKFHGSPAEQKAKAAARGVSRKHLS